MRRTWIAVAVLFAVVAAGAASAKQVAYPSSIVVLGHSGATGAGSDPAHPFRDTPVNSWATGTNPAVDSVYSRLVVVNPAVRGHAVNLAEDGARVTDFAAQVRKAVTLTPKPDLVLVQIGANDVQCDGHEETHYGEFKTAFADALGALSTGLPKARIFVVSEWTTLPEYVKYLQGLPLGARLKHAGKGLCQIVDSPSGRVVPSHAAYLAKAFAGYEAQLAAVCKRVPNCGYDGGAAHRIGLTAADMTHDQNHLTIQGLAKLAAVEWAAMSGFLR